MNNQYKLRQFTCVSCGKEVELRRPANKTQYCSLECYRSLSRPTRKTGEVIKCGNCGKEKYIPKNQIRDVNFCSTKCANEFQGRNKVNFKCKTCGEEFRWSKSRLKENNPTFCSLECRNKDKMHMKKCGLNSTIKQQKQKGLNKLELKGRDILNEIGVKFEEQVLMFDKFLVDVLVPEKKLIIQWDGEYWHTKPKRALLDKSQDKYLEKCGYSILRITDNQIKNNIKQVYENITRAI